MPIAQAIYTDPTVQGRGYKLAASSPQLSPADLAALALFPRESSYLANLRSPCDDQTTYRNFFPLANGNYALTQQFRAGGICRGYFRIVVHTIVLSREMLDDYHWDLALILDGCEFASPNYNGTFAQLQEQVGQYEIHQLPDLDINCTQAIIHDHEQQLYAQLRAMLGDATKRAKFIGALQALQRQQRIWFPPGTESEQLLLTIWSLLPLADRQQIFWMTGYNHNDINNNVGHNINFGLVSSTVDITAPKGFVSWHGLPVPARDPVPNIITSFMQQLEVLEDAQALHDLYAELQRYNLSLLAQPQKLQSYIIFRNKTTQLLAFYTQGCKDLAALATHLQDLRQCCWSDHMADPDPWFDKDQVLRGVCLTALHLYAAEPNTVRSIKNVSDVLERCAFIQLLPPPNELSQFFDKYPPAHLDTTLIAIAMVVWGPDLGTYAEITFLQKLYTIDNNMLRKPLNLLRRYIQNNLIFVALGNHGLPVEVEQQIQNDHELLNWLISRHSKEKHPNDDERGRALWQLAGQHDAKRRLLLDCSARHTPTCHREFVHDYYTSWIRSKPNDVVTLIADYFARENPDMDIMYDVIAHAYHQKPALLNQLFLQASSRKNILQILQATPTAQPHPTYYKIVVNGLFALSVANYLQDKDPDAQLNIMLQATAYGDLRLADQVQQSQLLAKLQKDRKDNSTSLEQTLQRIFAAIPPSPHLARKEMLNPSALTSQRGETARDAPTFRNL